MKSILILFGSLILGMTNPTSLNSNIEEQTCTAQIEVEKNRSFKSADEDGASFSILLTNTSNSETSFMLDAKNVTMSCSAQNKSPQNNVELNTAFEFSGTAPKGKGGNQVTLKAGETLKFKVNVTVPEGTAYKNWSCIEVSARAVSCRDIVFKTILSVYVPNPFEG